MYLSNVLLPKTDSVYLGSHRCCNEALLIRADAQVVDQVQIFVGKLGRRHNVQVPLVVFGT